MSKILKITEQTTYDDEGAGSISITVEADGTVHHDLAFHDGEPEDNNLGRNFHDCLSITSVLATVSKYVANGYTVEFVDGEQS